jgi:hypothetical protein
MRTHSLLQQGASKESVKYQTNGAAELIRMMLDADSIHFLVGQAVNPAHQNPELPHQLGIRTTIIREVADELRDRGKEVTIEEL